MHNQQVLDDIGFQDTKGKPIWKVVVFIGVLLIAPFVGGIYGFLHNQISFSVSPEFFNNFFFLLSDDPHDKIGGRLSAGIVGIMTTWWVGLFVGIVLGFIGLFHKDGRQMFKVTLIAIGVNIAVAFIIGLIGLAVGKYILSNGSNFTAASTMQNASYAGGLVGLIVASAYSIKKRSKANV